MKLTFKLLFVAILFSGFNGNAQDKKVKIKTIAFYNLENLFDTINDPTKADEKSPMMDIKKNRSKIYKKKVSNMARVLSEIGTNKKYSIKDSPAIIGVAEIENKQVLVDVINDPQLKDKDYGIIHFDSPDGRGIDVALLYRKKFFKPTDYSKHELLIYDDDSRERVFTRDQLLVTGMLDGDKIHVIVNHWPSRRGGEARSRPKRVAAAQLNKKIIDSIHAKEPYAKIISMGDLNDNPNNHSITKVLKAKDEKEKVKLKGIFNPMMKMFKKGLGSNAYRDSWSLFDQIMVTEGLINKKYEGYRFWKAGIYNESYLSNKKGRYKGYPLRSFVGATFTDGFSDHFPVYTYLVKEIE
ncbi:MAG: endonuclease/exonuclease/phosphatase family protein [Flavobacteriaceae bacterium]|nr:endonuclease/exonuclease/phosphatase family protein [Flavobacteriaceae bacterium]